ncbi:precorrin-4 C(11)-methyltransferase [Desulfitibacter alkalitolerans]|uniref:precorrin-4 C(11)-methyltransferase n=1 Tax=Desulfitibacter alkalitolerans TaxID=264641 RepID=UPI00048789CD|nr:precorrin-4 C(11)-methyltransferase [Desulfitibacter alkalitolerans]
MIFFVGAGSGDPELITLKGYKLLQEADLVVWAGSLVNEKVLDYTKAGARLVNSAHLDLEEIVETMVEAYNKGEKVVRLHTGDPSLYGAIGEQMELLKQKNVPFKVIPGVSSFLAAAASVQKEYTVPDGTQTVIITRMEGRTPVPARENLASLAAHGSSMAIFLSVGMIERVVEQLLEGYSPDTPAAVVEKASWPEERVLKGTLANLAQLTRDAGITKTALILVGNFLKDTGKSKLYDREFTHEYREGK